MYEMKRGKGNGYVTQTYELNRLDYIILDTLYDGSFKDYYHAITIAEMLELNNGALKRMTVYKKLQKLVKAEYIGKGIIDDHSDTYYLNSALNYNEEGTGTFILNALKIAL